MPYVTKEQQDILKKLKTMGVKSKHLERQVFERGLTLDDVEWNERFGRPLDFKETVHPAEELRRRAAWNEANPTAGSAVGAQTQRPVVR